MGGVKKLNNALQGHDVGETLGGDTFDRAWPFRILIFPQRKGRFPEHGSMIKQTESWTWVEAKTGHEAGSGDRMGLTAEPPARLRMEVLWDIGTFDHLWDGRAIFASIWFGRGLLYKLFSWKSMKLIGFVIVWLIWFYSVWVECAILQILITGAEATK